MTRQPRKRRLFLGSLATAGIILLGAIAGCMTFTSNTSSRQARVQKLFAKHGFAMPKSHFVTVDGHRIHYVDTGDPTKPLVVFIHGSPGEWEAFAGFLANPRLRAVVRMVSVDRPGYGQSEPGHVLPSLAEQAAVIKPILETNRSGRGAIVVGHSLGGPIAARVAMDFPKLVADLVLVAPSIDPSREHIKWFQYPARWPIFQWAVPKPLNVCNLEIFPLKQQLEKMLPLWSRIHQRVILIQGEKDELVSPENADFARRVMTNAQLTVETEPNLNHFIPWSAPQLITQAILVELKSPAAKSGTASIQSRRSVTIASAAPAARHAPAVPPGVDAN